ncbi:MAG: TrbI/VirB10 family protein [Bdellovibrionales bacterium]|nr:TrbI/VirB10 family protein [Bdellovibrionales bacterium]
MTSDNDRVEIVKDNGRKFQWPLNYILESEGGKKKIKKSLLVKLTWLIGSFLFMYLMIAEDKPEEVNGDFVKDIHLTKDVALPLQEFDAAKEEPKKSSPKNHQVIRYKSHAVISRKMIDIIPPGTMVKAILLTGGTDGPIKAKILEDVSAHGETFFKAESTVLGTGASGEERLVIGFNQLVDADGVTHEIVATAYDFDDKVLGLKGSKIGRTTKKILAATGAGLAGALYTPYDETVENGERKVKPNFNDRALNGLASASASVAQEEFESLKEKQTIIEVPQGTQTWIVFGR